MSQVARQVGFFCMAVGIFAAGASCGRGRQSRVGNTRNTYDTSPIDVSAFASQDAVRNRVFSMRFFEAASRLGSLRYEARVDFSFGRGEQEVQQSDRYSRSQDSSGNGRLVLETPASQVEFYVFGDDVLVRYDRGSLRQKTRRDTSVEALSDIVMSALPQALALFGPLAFSDPHGDRVEGRPATRYQVRLQKDGAPRPVAATVTPGVMWNQPLAPPPQWREQARPLDLTGFVSLDEATGVVLKAEVQGRLEIPDRKVQPTTMTLHLTAAVTEIGRVPAFKMPKAQPEARRIVRLKDPLSFFRDQVPLPKPEPSAP